MTPEIFYCFDDSEVEKASRLMEDKKIPRLPISDQGKRLIGIISLGDLALRSKHAPLTEEVLECVSEPAQARIDALGIVELKWSAHQSPLP